MELQWKSEWTTPTVVGVISFGVGAAVGYFVAKKHIKPVEVDIYHFDDEEEDANQAEDLQTLFGMEGNEREGWTTTRVIQENEVEVIVLEEDTEVEIVDIRRAKDSIFPIATPDWDYEVEIASRTSDKPYIIHRDEFFANEADYSQTTLTYYKGDDVLLDEQDIPLYDAKNIVCELEFGKGSEDPSVVYVRNDRLEHEYEVLLDNGYYQVEVLGEELEHSFELKHTPLHKFRD